MTDNELIEYCRKSIKECDAFKVEYMELKDDRTSHIFEGMSEAYSDILNRLIAKEV